MEAYKPRLVDQLFADKLDAFGAVLIEGPKYCGKTTTAEQQAKSRLYMADPAMREQNLLVASTNIRRLLQGPVPRMIDEWQIAPQLWDAIRFEVDHRGDDGQFILTGSAVPADRSQIFHTGTGRFGWIRMRPMTLWESGDSTGDVRLADLFRSTEAADGASAIDMGRLAYLTCRGGWPKAALKRRERTALLEADEYVEAVCRSDISRADGIGRSPDTARRLLRSLARHQGQQVPVSTLLADLINNESGQITENTIVSYVNALKQIFVVEDMTAWNPNLRSKTAIRTSDTRYFVDPSVATGALGLGPDDLLDDLNTFGLLFETLAVRDLRVYADTLRGGVSHYRDKNGLECDAVVHLRNGSYGLVEIKLGGDRLIADGVATLRKLAGKIDTGRMGDPAFLMVLTGIGQYAYRRPDGVVVVPIGALRA